MKIWQSWRPSALWPGKWNFGKQLVVQIWQKINNRDKTPTYNFPQPNFNFVPYADCHSRSFTVADVQDASHKLFWLKQHSTFKNVGWNTANRCPNILCISSRCGARAIFSQEQKFLLININIASHDAQSTGWLILSSPTVVYKCVRLYFCVRDVQLLPCRFEERGARDERRACDKPGVQGPSACLSARHARPMSEKREVADTYIML